MIAVQGATAFVMWFAILCCFRVACACHAAWPSVLTPVHGLAAEKPSSRLRVLYWTLGFCVAVAILYAGDYRYHFWHRLQVWLVDAPVADHAVAAGQLQDYVVEIDALPLAEVQNLSGLAWDDAEGHLVAVLNKPEMLMILDRDGKQLANYRLQDFNDTEGVAALGGGWYVVAEERRSQLAFFRVPPGRSGGEIRHVDAMILGLDLHPSAPSNLGFEGLAYDPQNDALFVVREDTPVQLYEITGIASLRDKGTMSALRIRNRSELLSGLRPSDDLSSVEVDPRSGNLLFLSERGQRLTEVRRDSRIAGVRRFDGVFGSETPMPQAEGVTIDPDHRLYIVSEPNLFYRFALASSSAERAAPTSR